MQIDEYEAPIPEPASLGVLGLIGGGAQMLRRRGGKA
jgi:hypothetical protein